MDENDFYEEDESIEERRAAWKTGERGVTSGSRDLNERAKAIVDRVTARWDADEPGPAVKVRIVSSATLSHSPDHVESDEHSTDVVRQMA